MRLSSLRYIYHSLANPRARALGFLDSGFGIERRYRRYQHQWQPHLDRCRKIQETLCNDVRHSGRSFDSIAVLGAGRLYDVNIPALVDTFRDVHLFDADPSVAPDWRKLRKRLDPTVQLEEHLGDITGVLAGWVKELGKRLNSVRVQRLPSAERWKLAIEVIRNLPRESSTAEELPQSTFINSNKFGAIVSLNLLSQLPLPWQDAIAFQLRRLFSANWIAEHETEWLFAYLEGAEALVRQHLRDLSKSGAASLLIITDLHYDHVMESNGISTVERISALGHIPLHEGTLQQFFPQYGLADRQEWTWNVVPHARRGERVQVHHVGSLQLHLK